MAEKAADFAKTGCQRITFRLGVNSFFTFRAVSRSGGRRTPNHTAGTRDSGGKQHGGCFFTCIGIHGWRCLARRNPITDPPQPPTPPLHQLRINN